MARIPEQEVQRLKDEIAVQRLVESAGFDLKRVGKDLSGRCPFHDDATASMVWPPSRMCSNSAGVKLHFLLAASSFKNRH